MNLLPSDRYLASMLGLTDEEYAWFKAEVKRRAAEQPEPAVIAGVETVLAVVSLAIGIGSTVVSTLLRPKPTFDQQEPGRPAELRAINRGGQATTQNQRYAPRYGFNSTQDISTLGSIIPLIYTWREGISGTDYGGVRVNASLLWSQIYSLGGSQMLRAVFLLGEGPIASIDPKNFASGDNTLSSYDFGNATANDVGSRMAVYRRISSNLTTRIQPSDHIYGRDPAEDVGNTNNITVGSTDVFGVRVGNSVTTHFCSAHRPGNQTAFGVYTLIGNDFGYRVNPVFEPQVRSQLIPEGEEGESRVKCVLDEGLWARRQKQQAFFGSRSGITSSGLGSIGGSTTYKLFSSSDRLTAFSRDLKDLNNEAEWTITKQLVNPETGGVIEKPYNDGTGFNKAAKTKYKQTNNPVSSLLNRFTVGIHKVETNDQFSGPIVGGVPSFDFDAVPGLLGPYQWVGTIGGAVSGDGRYGYIAITVTLDITGFDNYINAGNSTINEELELLKASKLKVVVTNDLTDDDPGDDVRVVQYYKVLIDSETERILKLTQPSYTAPTYSSPSLATSTTTIDGTTVLTGASLSGGGITSGSVTFSELDIADTIPEPRFRIKPADSSATTSEFKPSTHNNFTIVHASQFLYKNAFLESCEDVAQAVAGRQYKWDDSIVPGELYKIGTGLAVCTSRTNGSFSSEVDGATTDVTATFKTVRTGVVTTNDQAQITLDGDDWLYPSPSERRNVATTDGHIFRCAIASISTTKPCKIVELGIRSKLGIRMNGVCDFASAKSYTYIDGRACLDYKDNVLAEGTVIYTDNHRSNTVATNIERYSFFAISWRVAGSTGGFTRLQDAYGVRSSTFQNVFNYIQLDMGSVKQWEFQIEPYTGYEIRNHVTGTLYILDSSLDINTTVSVSDPSGVTVLFAGFSVTKSADTFAIPAGRRPVSTPVFGHVQTDADYDNGDESFIDTWGKLAEGFIYEEITTSADGGPEHEVVYINEIVPNDSTPVYDNLALIGVNINSSVEWQQFNQFSCYVTGGLQIRRLRNSLATGPSHLFPDIALDLMTNTTYGRGELITDDMIDLTEFEAAANWCYNRKYFFDGVIADRINLRQWCADVAATHLLIFGESDGKFFLRPALQFDAVTIKGLFTAGNIVEGSFKLQYFDPEERDPIQVSVRYREERASTNLDNPGTFPTVREVLVRESSASSSVALEAIDMSDYCTNRDHAIDAAKFVIRMRRIPTHTISFTTTHEGVLMSMAPGDYIKVGMDATEYDEFNNGVVTPEGALVSTKTLSDGTHTVIAWNGDADTAPADATLTVSNSGKTASPTGVVFTVKLPSTQVRTYQIERITPTEDGAFTIEAVHMPTNSSDILELADGFDTAGNWTIQG